MPMDLLHVFYLLGAGLTGSRYYCSAVWPSRFGGSLKDELLVLLMLGLLWLGGVMIADVLGYIVFDVQIISDLASWQPFQSRWLGWMNVGQFGSVFLAITLFLFFDSMRKETFVLFNPLMDFAMISIFYAIFCPAAILLLWLADLALVRFF
jgi:hypothetical protein